MSTLRFSAHCERGHDPVDFTDPAAFEAHMMGEHKARKRMAGGSANGSGPRVNAPGWSGGKPAAPLPWKAPKAPTTTEKLTAVLLAAGSDRKYAVRGCDGLDPEWSTDDVVPVTDLAPGDVFVAAEAWGIRYAVLDTDPEKGWHLERITEAAQAGPARSRWLRELKLPRSGVLETVIRVGRAA